MAEKKPIALYGGKFKELQDGDTIPGTEGHTHTNKVILDSLTDDGERLNFEGVPYAKLDDVTGDIPTATEDQAGTVEIATDVEAVAEVSNRKSLVPRNLTAWLADVLKRPLTWIAKQTFNAAPNFGFTTSTPGGRIVEVDVNKNVSTVAKKGAYNKDFGTTAGTVAQGNDSRFHAHPNKTQIDKLGETGGNPTYGGDRLARHSELNEDQDAAGVPFDPAGLITADNVQDAIMQAAGLIPSGNAVRATYPNPDSLIKGTPVGINSDLEAEKCLMNEDENGVEYAGLIETILGGNCVVNLGGVINTEGWTDDEGDPLLPNTVYYLTPTGTLSSTVIGDYEKPVLQTYSATQGQVMHFMPIYNKQAQPVAPGTPTLNPAVEVDNTSFIISWDEVALADEYRVDIATDPGFNNILPAYDNIKVLGTQLNAEGLTPVTTYYVRVRGVGGTIGSNSDTWIVKTRPLVSVWAESPNDWSKSHVNISWSMVDGLTFYTLKSYLGDTDLGVLSDGQAADAESGKMFCLIENLAANTEYTITARWKDDQGNESKESVGFNIKTAKIGIDDFTGMTVSNQGSGGGKDKIGDWEVFYVENSLQVSDNILLFRKGVGQTKARLTYVGSDLIAGKAYEFLVVSDYDPGQPLENETIAEFTSKIAEGTDETKLIDSPNGTVLTALLDNANGSLGITYEGNQLNEVWLTIRKLMIREL